MKVRNMPARVERRRLRATMPKGEKTEPDVSQLLSVRTKIARKDSGRKR